METNLKTLFSKFYIVFFSGQKRRWQRGEDDGFTETKLDVFTTTQCRSIDGTLSWEIDVGRKKWSGRFSSWNAQSEKDGSNLVSHISISTYNITIFSSKDVITIIFTAKLLVKHYANYYMKLFNEGAPCKNFQFSVVRICAKRAG